MTGGARFNLSRLVFFTKTPSLRRTIPPTPIPRRPSCSRSRRIWMSRRRAGPSRPLPSSAGAARRRSMVGRGPAPPREARCLGGPLGLAVPIPRCPSCSRSWSRWTRRRCRAGPSRPTPSSVGAAWRRSMGRRGLAPPRADPAMGRRDRRCSRPGRGRTAWGRPACSSGAAMRWRRAAAAQEPSAPTPAPQNPFWG
jgi:hypothetical protein